MSKRSKKKDELQKKLRRKAKEFSSDRTADRADETDPAEESEALLELEGDDQFISRLTTDLSKRFPGLLEGLGPVEDSDGFSPDPDTPREQALDLLDAAYDAPVKRARKLASDALAIDPNCHQAHSLLAELAADADEAERHYRDALAASARALEAEGGPEESPYCEDHAYVHVEFARFLRDRQRIDDSIAQYQMALLFLPEGDGYIHSELLSLLLLEQRMTDALELLANHHEDGSAVWAYGKALFSFQAGGADDDANGLLCEALRVNKHLSKLLLGVQPMPRELPPMYSPGSREEAMHAAAFLLPAFKGTPGATAWLRAQVDAPALAGSSRKAKPWKSLAKSLAKLPQDTTVRWEMAIRRIDADPTDEDASLWMVLICDAASRELLFHDMLPEAPTPVNIRQALAKAIKNPHEGDPHRPSRIAVDDEQWVALLRDDLSAVNVGVDYQPEMPLVDALMEQMAGGLAALAGRSAAPVADDDLESLPREPMEIWTADERSLSLWMEDAGQAYRPRMALVVDSYSRAILGMNMPEQGDPGGDLWPTLAKAMAQPALGSPRRPGAVRVASEAMRSALAPKLERIAVACEVGAIEALDEAFEDISKNMAGNAGMSPLLSVPGITPAIAAGYFAAAADFYLKKPWTRIGWNAIIRIETPAVQSGPWFAAVMGQSGIETGLALYENEAHLRELHSGKITHQQHAKHLSALHVSFGEVFHMTPDDVDAIERHNWHIAGPEAYPVVMRVNPGPAVRAPLAWELRLLEAALRGISSFVAAGARKPFSAQVETAQGAIPLKLSLA